MAAFDLDTFQVIIFPVFHTVLPGNDSISPAVYGSGWYRRWLCQEVGPAVMGFPDRLTVEDAVQGINVGLLGLTP